MDVGVGVSGAGYVCEVYLYRWIYSLARTASASVTQGQRHTGNRREKHEYLPMASHRDQMLGWEKNENKRKEKNANEKKSHSLLIALFTVHQ